MLKNKIRAAIEKEMMDTGKMGTETVTASITLTDDEKDEFFHMDEFDGPHYSWDFNENELCISYAEELVATTIKDLQANYEGLIFLLNEKEIADLKAGTEIRKVHETLLGFVPYVLESIDHEITGIKADKCLRFFELNVRALNSKVSEKAVAYAMH